LPVAWNARPAARSGAQAATRASRAWSEDDADLAGQAEFGRGTRSTPSDTLCQPAAGYAEKRRASHNSRSGDDAFSRRSRKLNIE
jgi:hypothetical protein